MLSRMLAVRATPLHMVAQRPMLVTRSLSVMTRFGGRTGPTSTVVMARSAISSSSFVQAPRPKSSSTTSKPASEAAALRKEAAKIKREAEKAKREAAKLKAKEHKLKQKEKEKERKVKEREKKQREKERAKAKKEKEAAAKKKPSTRTKLTPPKAPQNTWSIFLQDYIEAAKADGSLASRGLNVSQLTREAAPKYHELSSDERAALSRRAEQQKEAWPAIYEEWKRSLTPEMIREENLVRQRRRKLGLAHKRNLRLPDEPKRPLTAFLRSAIPAADLKDSILADPRRLQILEGCAFGLDKVVHSQRRAGRDKGLEAHRRSVARDVARGQEAVRGPAACGARTLPAREEGVGREARHLQVVVAREN